MRINKNFRRVIASILVATMVFANEGTMTLASTDMMDNVELTNESSEIAKEVLEEVKKENETEEETIETIEETVEETKEVLNEDEEETGEVLSEIVEETKANIEEEIEKSGPTVDLEESEEETECEEAEEDVVQETILTEIDEETEIETKEKIEEEIKDEVEEEIIEESEEEEETTLINLDAEEIEEEVETEEVIEEIEETAEETSEEETTTIINLDVEDKTLEEVTSETVEETEEKTVVEAIEIIEEATTSEIEENSIDLDITEIEEVVGVAAIEKDIVLDFGIGNPTMANSDFSGVSSKFTSLGDNKYKLVGTAGTPIANVITGLAASKYITYGSGQHVKMPEFPGISWDGYTFAGWEDDDGVRITEFNYAFQPEVTAGGYMTYTAIWSVKTDYKVNIYSEYKNENAASLGNDREMLPKATKSNIKPGAVISVSGKTIPGYKIKRYELSCDGVPESEMFKDKMYDGSFKALDDPITYDSSSMIFTGAMPNHNITITYYYEPDNDTAKAFTILYLDKDLGTTVQSSPPSYPAPETEIEAHAIAITGYEFDHVEMEVQYTDVMPQGVYGLGTYHLDGEIFPPNAAGDFKAKMINQKITLRYYYRLLDASKVLVNCTYTFEGHDSFTQSREVSIGGDITFPLDNDRSVFPLAEMPGYTFLSFNAPETSGISAIDVKDTYGDPEIGKLSVHIDAIGTKNFVIDFAYDYTKTNYWKKVSFKSSENGSLVASPSTAEDLDYRFISVGEHTYADIIKDVGTVPSSDVYMFGNWYRGSSTGIGKDPAYPDPINLSDTITVLETDEKVILYGEFIEDPSKIVYIDFALESEEHGHIIQPTTSFRVFTNSAISGITFPSLANGGLIKDNGFDFTGWRFTYGGTEYIEPQTEDAIKTTIMPTCTENVHFVGVISPHIEDDGNYHKPAVEITYEASGKGKAKLFGTFSLRQYILTKYNGEVIEKLTGNEMVAASGKFATELYPGMMYKAYEINKDIDLTTVANVSDVSDSLRSEPYEINVPAIREYTITSAATGYTINFTKVTGVEYALLNKDFTEEIAFNANPTFANLSDGDHYIVVARKAGESISSTSNECISQCVAVHTSQHDITGREYRIVMDGGQVYGKTANETNVYYVAGNTANIKLKGTTGNKWSVDNGDISVVDVDVMPTITMPNTDLYVSNKSTAGTYNNAKLEIIKNGINIDVADKITVLKTLAAALPTEITSEGYEIKYYIVFNKKGQNDATSPYAIGMDVYMTVQGVLKDFTLPATYTSGIPVIYLFDKEILANTNYKLYKNGSTIDINTTTNLEGTVGGYSAADQEKISSVSFKMSAGDTASVVCDKTYELKFKAETIKTSGVSGVTFNNTYNLIAGSNLSAISDYTTAVVPMMEDQKNESTNVGASKYNTVIFLYKGIYEDPTDATTLIDPATYTVDKNVTLTLKYEEDAERNAKKAALKTLVDTAKSILDQPIGQVETNMNAINNGLNADIGGLGVGAITIVDQQPDYTCAQIEEATVALQYILDHLDPIPAVHYAVYIDANGGAADVSEIDVIDGEKFTALSTVSVIYTDYIFKSWNTEADGSGTTITKDTVANSSHNEITLYAIWRSAFEPEPDPTPDPTPIPKKRGGGGGGGGGGGSTGGRTDVKTQYLTSMGEINEEAECKPIVTSPTGMAFLNGVGFANQKNGILFSKIDENNDIGLYYCNDDNTFVVNTWASVKFMNNEQNNMQKQEAVYYFGADGKAKSGLFTEGNNVYYLSKEKNKTYGQLKTGWIYDEQAQKWYYGDGLTGALRTGWQVIDNKLYYFNTSTVVDAQGKLDVNNLNYGSGYGQLLTNCMTPDGYMVNNEGVAVLK